MTRVSEWDLYVLASTTTTCSQVGRARAWTCASNQLNRKAASQSIVVFTNKVVPPVPSSRNRIASDYTTHRSMISIGGAAGTAAERHLSLFQRRAEGILDKPVNAALTRRRSAQESRERFSNILVATRLHDVM